MKTEKRLDHHFRDFEQDGAKIAEHSQRSLKERRLTKAGAYRMAKSFIAMRDMDFNGLRALITSSGLDVDGWLDKWFAPLEVLGDEYRSLLTAIEKGMTQKQYLSQTASVFLLKKQKARVEELHDPPAPAKPPETLSLEEREVQWRRRAIALEVQLRDERKLRREYAKRVNVLEKTTKRLSRELGKVMTV